MLSRDSTRRGHTPLFLVPSWILFPSNPRRVQGRVVPTEGQMVDGLSR